MPLEFLLRRSSAGRRHSPVEVPVSRFIPFLVALTVVAPQFVAEAKAEPYDQHAPRAYYTCDMMSGRWTDIREGQTFTCSDKKDSRQSSGGLHCESECTILIIRASGQTRKTIKSPPGMSRGFTFVHPGDKIKVLIIR